MRPHVQIAGRRVMRLSLALALMACGLSCGSSPIAHDDGGGGAGAMDAPVVDRPVSGAGGAGDSGNGADASADHVAGIGETCQVAGDCGSGHCTDGVCCSTECAGMCQSCALPGNLGTCLLADPGTDPRNDCQDQGVASCGNDGTCDGSGACRTYPTGIVCKQPSCVGSTLTLASRCSGGACVPTSGQPCDPYVCTAASSTSCPATCTKDADCLAPNTCVNGSCGKRPLGTACDDDMQCNSGKCQ